MEQARGPDFRAFVAGLAASAAAALEVSQQALGGTGEGEAVSDEDRGTQVQQGLAQARYVVDALSMLERKTSGNLTEDETRFLKAALTDLRIAFVRVDDHARQGRPRAEAPPADTDD